MEDLLLGLGQPDGLVMLIKKKLGSHTLHTSKPLLTKVSDGYIRPTEGKEWWQTTTTVWRIDELLGRSIRNWRRLTGETGHDGTRSETMRKDHDSIYTGTHSVFPAPLMEWIILRYGGPPGGKILDAFAGGPVRGVISSLMGMEYWGVELRIEQIRENLSVINDLKIDFPGNYTETDGRYLDLTVGGCGPPEGGFDCAITCPPYHSLERYSNRPDDLSNLGSYDEFNTAIAQCAAAHYPLMKSGAFVCIVVAPFRDKRTGELIDFPGHTTANFKKAGFLYWQQIALVKNFASAALRSTNAWRGHKLVPSHEFLLVFRKPQ